MERDIFRLMVAALRPWTRTCPRGQLYSDGDIVLIAMWAVLHDRPISWATDRRNWPMQAWRRRLPDQSTMSRRLRSGSVGGLLQAVLVAIARAEGPAKVAIIDGKALHIARHSRDPDARRGWGTGGFGRGYKLHTLITPEGRVLAWRVCAMCEGECTVAAELVREAWERGLLARGALVLGDAGYDSNPLHAALGGMGLRLIAPRKMPGTGLGAGSPGRHHPHRHVSIRLTEYCPRLFLEFHRVRVHVERFYSSLTAFGGGLTTLPPWARRHHRVSQWVALKLLVHWARRQLMANHSRTAAA